MRSNSQPKNYTLVQKRMDPNVHSVLLEKSKTKIIKNNFHNVKPMTKIKYQQIDKTYPVKVMRERYRHQTSLDRLEVCDLMRQLTERSHLEALAVKPQPKLE